MNFQQAKSLFLGNGLDYSPELHDKLQKYYDFLIEYNKNVNLTAITDENEVWLKHFLDSIVILRYIDIPQNAAVIDVGTGAGFPSVPLKLYRNDLILTLLDSLNKRITFLDKLSTILEINVETFHSRAEEGANKEALRECYDFAVARAVASLPVLCEYCMGYVKVGGTFIAMKGVNEDLMKGEKAVKTMGGQVDKIEKYQLNGTEGRMLFTAKKISHTPRKYPRNSSQIKSKPL